MRPIPAAPRHQASLFAVAAFVAAAATLAPSAAAAGHVGPPGPEPREGTATFTDLTGPGACSFPGEPPDNLHVGLSSPEYGTAAGCGGYLDVTGPSGTVRVKITDHCRRCDAGLIDITRTAFARIGDVDAGRVPVTYELVRNPPLAEAISLRIKTGSSRWWLQIQALDHGNPIARFEVLQEDGWRALAHTTDNYWEASDPGLGEGPFTVRLTDVFDQQVTIDDVVLAPDTVQPTTARLYPAAEAPATPEASATTVPSTEPADLAPPLSTPLSDPSTRSRSAPISGRSAPDDEDSDNGTAPLWPLFVALGAAAVVARLVTRQRARRRLPRPTAP